MKKLFSFIKYISILLVGLMPGIVLKLYSPDQAYDMLYSIIIWVLLLLIDAGQESASRYTHNQEEEQYENQTKR